jgi:hypothetical protein
MFQLDGTIKEGTQYSMPFIYSLYNDIVSCTDCVASNGRPSSEQRIGRGAKEAVMALFQVLYQHFTRDTAENLDSNSFRKELVIVFICDFLLYYRGFLLYHLSTVYTRLAESSSAHLLTSVGKLRKEMKLCRSTIRQW